jgi:hypothetical protein
MNNYKYNNKIFKIVLFNNECNKYISRTINKVNNYGHLLNYINVILNDYKYKNYNLLKCDIENEKDIINNNLYKLLIIDIKNKKKIISFDK